MPYLRTTVNEVDEEFPQDFLLGASLISETEETKEENIDYARIQINVTGIKIHKSIRIVPRDE